MEFTIKQQEKFSRLQLVLRTLFGGIYIQIPHLFIMFFVSIWAAILTFLAFWVILFTGKYPKSWYEFQIGCLSWSSRFLASFLNLIDGYPQIGPGGSNPSITLNAPYPESLSRVTLILKVLFGWLYVAIPHGFCLFFRLIWGFVLVFLAWWVVLFTGKYPQGFFNYQVGTLRWSLRYSLYLGLLSDKYPPFSGK